MADDTDIRKWIDFQSIVERFNRGYIPEPMTGCFLWLKPSAGKNRDYGATTIGHRRKNRRHISAHRLAWEIKNGPIPKGMCVCHRCDVPSCVNIDHLFLGTQKQNMADCKKKGRIKPPRVGSGPANPNARLSYRDISRISSSDLGVPTLAAMYGVSAFTIRRVRKIYAMSKDNHSS